MAEPTQNAESERVEIVDAETGEVYCTERGPVTDPAFKGWLLRTRTAYGRRTGHKLIVRPVQNDSSGADDA
jgi:hypothetical protein